MSFLIEFLGNTEINFFKVGFQKPRWSLQASTSFILSEHIGSGCLGDCVSTCVYAAWVKTKLQPWGLSLPAYSYAAGVNTLLSLPPRFRCGSDSLVGGIHLKSHTAVCVGGASVSITPQSHTLAFETPFLRMWTRPEKYRPALCLPSCGACSG